MEDLTFGEQVKIILGRKGMTIKQLAEMIEVKTGKKMSRQNLTQRLGRDNFQEQDMRMIAEILECPFRLSILGGEVQPLVKNKVADVKGMETQTENIESAEKKPEFVLQADGGQSTEMKQPETQEQHSSTEEVLAADERDMTIGELYDIHEELSEMEESIKAGEPVEKAKEELSRKKKSRFSPVSIFQRRKHTEEPAEIAAEEPDSVREAGQGSVESEEPEKEKSAKEVKEVYEADTSETVSGEENETAAAKEEADDFEPVISRDDSDEDTVLGDVNPYTGREYQSNSVRMHPTRIGYVQVYDRTIHKWTDMTEWAFLGYQERKKTLLGKAYEPPIYLD